MDKLNRARFSAYTARYRQRKRLAGLCIEHGCWEPIDGTSCHCLACKKIHTQKAREYRERKRAKLVLAYVEDKEQAS